MINFIKQAVESVEGIKSFLFNTDYRNNFDLQKVEFPCCVLTPIMRTNYDLNNIIRESAELQLSVVETAPYEYTGDDLYAINKRCSELALQVIANLQVKSKLDKELTFEFILPSGDEFISGVMCNLTATMKQGSCIGAPSYVEVIVQPIKRESITRNGKHIIAPSSGFNAMREVEVEVQVEGQASAVLQEKQLTITTNNSTTDIVADEGFDGLDKVSVSVEIEVPKIEPTKQVTFNDNIATTITPSDGFDAMAEVNVCVDVKNLATLQFNWEGNTSDNTPNYGYYLDDIYEKQIDAYFSNKGQAREGYGDAIFNLTNLDGDWTELYKKVTINDFGLPYSEKKIFVFPQFHFDETATELQIFPKKLYNAFRGCCAMIAIPPIDLRNTTDIRYAFKECYSLVILLLNNWSAGNIDLSDCYNLEYSYLNHLIEYSTGQKMRTLTIPECVNEKWEKYYKYEYYVTLAAEKAITITIK